MKTSYNYIKALAVFILLFLVNTIKAEDYYWVGGSGSWSDFHLHWAKTDGGTVFHTKVPTADDNVYFTDKSFYGAETAMNVVLEGTVCRAKNFDCSAVGTKTINFTDNNIESLEISNNFILAQNIKFRVSCDTKLLGNLSTDADRNILDTKAVEVTSRLIIKGFYALSSNLRADAGIDLNKSSLSDKGEARQLFLGGENIFVKAGYVNFSELDHSEIILGKYTDCTKFYTSYSTAKSYMLKKIIIEGKAKLDGRNEFQRKDSKDIDRRLGEELIIKATGELVYSDYNIRFKKIQIFGKVNTKDLSADNLYLEPNSDSKIYNLKVFEHLVSNGTQGNKAKLEIPTRLYYWGADGVGGYDDPSKIYMLHYIDLYLQGVLLSNHNYGIKLWGVDNGLLSGNLVGLAYYSTPNLLIASNDLYWMGSNPRKASLCIEQFKKPITNKSIYFVGDNSTNQLEDVTNWSLSSGGTPFADTEIIDFLSCDLVFDENSLKNQSGTSTLDYKSVIIRNLNCLNLTKNIVFNGNFISIGSKIDLCDKVSFKGQLYLRTTTTFNQNNAPKIPYVVTKTSNVNATSGLNIRKLESNYAAASHRYIRVAGQDAICDTIIRTGVSGVSSNQQRATAEFSTTDNIRLITKRIVYTGIGHYTGNSVIKGFSAVKSNYINIYSGYIESDLVQTDTLILGRKLKLTDTPIVSKIKDLYANYLENKPTYKGSAMEQSLDYMEVPSFRNFSNNKDVIIKGKLRLCHCLLGIPGQTLDLTGAEIEMDQSVSATHSKSVFNLSKNSKIKGGILRSDEDITLDNIVLEDQVHDNADGKVFRATNSIGIGINNDAVQNNGNWTIEEPTARNLYWIGGDGKWSELSHWATNAEGTILATALPRAKDKVIINKKSAGSSDTFTIELDYKNIEIEEFTVSDDCEKNFSFAIPTKSDQEVTFICKNFKTNSKLFVKKNILNIILKSIDTSDHLTLDANNVTFTNVDLHNSTTVVNSLSAENITVHRGTITLDKNVFVAQKLHCLDGELTSTNELSIDFLGESDSQCIIELPCTINLPKATFNFYKYTSSSLELKQPSLEKPGVMKAINLKKINIAAVEDASLSVYFGNTDAEIKAENITDNNTLELTLEIYNSHIHKAELLYNTIIKNIQDYRYFVNQFDVLTFNQNCVYTFTAGRYYKINQAWNSTGSPNKPIEVKTSANGDKAYINFNTPDQCLSMDYVNLSDIVSYISIKNESATSIEEKFYLCENIYLGSHSTYIGATEGQLAINGFKLTGGLEKYKTPVLAPINRRANYISNTPGSPNAYKGCYKLTVESKEGEVLDLPVDYQWVLPSGTVVKPEQIHSNGFYDAQLDLTFPTDAKVLAIQAMGINPEACYANSDMINLNIAGFYTEKHSLVARVESSFVGVAGETVFSISLTAQGLTDKNSKITDYNYNGTHNVNITGLTASPKGRLCRLNGVEKLPAALVGGKLPTSLNFTEGVASFDIVLYNAKANQQLGAEVNDLANPAANTSKKITTVNNVANELVIETQPTFSTAPGSKQFTTQPVLKVIDAYGNVVANSANKIVATKGAGLTWDVDIDSDNNQVKPNSLGIATYSKLAITRNLADRYKPANGAKVLFSLLNNAGDKTISILSDAFNIVGFTPKHHCAITAYSDNYIAGEAKDITFSIYGSDDIVDDTFTGNLEIKFGGYGSVDDRNGTTYRASLSGVEMGGSTQSANVSFVNGVATVPIIFKAKGTRTASFEIAGIVESIPRAGNKAVTVNHAQPNYMQVEVQPILPATEGGAVFSTQPKVKLYDQFGNFATESGVTLTASVGKGTGNWNVTGTTTTTITSGIGTFSGLEAKIVHANRYQNQSGLTLKISGTFGSTLIEEETASFAMTAYKPAWTCEAVYPKNTFSIDEPQNVIINVRGSDGEIDETFDKSGASAINLKIENLNKTISGNKIGRVLGQEITALPYVKTQALTFTDGVATMPLMLMCVGTVQPQITLGTEVNTQLADNTYQPGDNKLTVLGGAATKIEFALDPVFDETTAESGVLTTYPKLRAIDKYGNIANYQEAITIEQVTPTGQPENQDNTYWAIENIPADIKFTNGEATLSGFETKNYNPFDVNAKVKFVSTTFEVESAEFTMKASDSPLKLVINYEEAIAPETKLSIDNPFNTTIVIKNGHNKQALHIDGNYNLTLSEVEKSSDISAADRFYGKLMDQVVAKSTTKETGEATKSIAIADGQVVVPIHIYKSNTNHPLNYAVDYTGTSITGTKNLNLRSGNSHHLKIRTQPMANDQEGGGLLKTQPVIELYDQFENLIIENSSDKILVAKSATGVNNWDLYPNPAPELSLINGVASFTNLEAKNEHYTPITNAIMSFALVGNAHVTPIDSDPMTIKPWTPAYKSVAIDYLTDTNTDGKYDGLTGVDYKFKIHILDSRPTPTIDATYDGEREIELTGLPLGNLLNNEISAVVNGVKLKEITAATPHKIKVNFTQGVSDDIIIQFQKAGDLPLDIQIKDLNNDKTLADFGMTSIGANPTKVSIYNQPVLSDTWGGATFTTQPKVGFSDEFGNAVDKSGTQIQVEQFTEAPYNNDDWTLEGTTFISLDADGKASFTNLAAHTTGFNDIKAKLQFSVVGIENKFQSDEFIIYQALGQPTAVIETDNNGLLNCEYPQLILRGNKSTDRTGTQDVNINYKWEKDGLILSGEINKELLINEPGTYKLTVTNQKPIRGGVPHGTSHFTEYVITKNMGEPTAKIEIADNAYLSCKKSAVLLNSESSLNWEKNTGNIVYEWYKDDEKLTETGAQITLNEIGNYKVKVIDNLTKCSNELEKIIVFDHTDCSTLNYTKEDIKCFLQTNGKISLELPNEYAKQFIDFGVINTTTSTEKDWQSSNEFVNLNKGIYTLKYRLKSDNALGNEIGNIEIVEPQDIEYTYETENPLTPESNDGEIRLNVTGGVGVYTFYDNNIEFNTNEKLDLTRGEHTLLIKDENECTKAFEFKLLSTLETFRPSRLLTPNGDGQNDVFLIDNIHKLGKCKLIVFDKWGNVVYQKYPYSNEQAWDGKSDGSGSISEGDLPAGTYYYVIEFPKLLKPFKSFIELLKEKK